MKFIILFFLVISIQLAAQEKKDISQGAIKTEVKEWMTKISLNHELRAAMLTMILDNTNNNSGEMTMMGEKILDNPEMNSIMTAMVTSGNLSIQPRRVFDDSTRATGIK